MLLLWLLCSPLRPPGKLCDFPCAVSHSLVLSVPLSSAGYNTVVRIPAGATNIDIKQVSYSGKPEDDNYLGELWFQATLYQVAFFFFFFSLGELNP